MSKNGKGTQGTNQRKAGSKGKQPDSPSDSPPRTLIQKPKQEFAPEEPWNTKEFLEKFPMEGSPQYNHDIELLKQGKRVTGPNQPKPHLPLTPAKPQASKEENKGKPPASSRGEKPKKPEARGEKFDDSYFNTPEFLEKFPMVRSEQYGYDIELLKQGRLKQGKPVAAQKPQPKPAPSKKDNAVKKNQKWVDKNKKEKPGTGKGKGGR